MDSPPTLPPATLPWPDLLAGAASSTRRLVAAHSRHFLALSSLLLLPLALLLLALPCPFLPASAFSPAAPSVSLRAPPDPQRDPLPVPLPAVALAATLLYLAAFAAAAASAHAGFFGRPVRLLASLRSVPASLTRLVVTALPASPLALLPLLPLPAPLPRCAPHPRLCPPIPILVPCRRRCRGRIHRRFPPAPPQLPPALGRAPCRSLRFPDLRRRIRRHALGVRRGGRGDVRRCRWVGCHGARGRQGGGWHSAACCDDAVRDGGQHCAVHALPRTARGARWGDLQRVRGHVCLPAL